MNPDHKPVFLVADDHSLIRQGVVLMIEDAGLDAEVSEASSLMRIREILGSRPVDFAVMDANFPDGNVLGVLPELKKLQPDLKILIFTGVDETTQALRYLNAGADGFLSKLSEEEEIAHAIRCLCDEGGYVSKTTRELLVSSVQDKNLLDPLLRLTEREYEIADMYAKGLGNLEIANILDLKQNTVSTFKKRIFEKLGISSIVELAELIRSRQ